MNRGNENEYIESDINEENQSENMDNNNLQVNMESQSNEQNSNLDARVDSFPVSPIRRFKSSETNQQSPSKSKSMIKCEQLYSLSKGFHKRKEEVKKQAELEKEMKSLEYCTFTPKVNKYKGFDTSSTASTDILHKTSYTEYVDKLKKFRESHKQTEANFENRIGSGKNWKKQVNNDGIKIEEPMKYKNAVNYLHNKLHQMQI